MSYIKWIANGSSISLHRISLSSVNLSFLPHTSTLAWIDSALGLVRLVVVCGRWQQRNVLKSTIASFSKYTWFDLVRPSADCASCNLSLRFLKDVAESTLQEFRSINIARLDECLVNLVGVVRNL